jgi:hypothetical protein
MGSVLLVERVAVVRVRRRLAQAAPVARDRPGHPGVAALGSRVVARVDRSPPGGDGCGPPREEAAPVCP